MIRRGRDNKKILLEVYKEIIANVKSLKNVCHASYEV